MNGRSWCPVCSMLAAVIAVASLGLLPDTAALAYTPESPEVKKVVDQAIKFLETGDADERPGGKALVALALLKYGKPKDHAKVKEAAEHIRNILGKMEPENVRMVL